MTTDFDIKRIAELSQIKLLPAEENTLNKQLSSVINHFNELKEVNTDNIEPTSQTTGLTDVLRPDEIRPNNILTSEEAISGKDDKQSLRLRLKKIHNNYFVVPMLINKK